MPNVGAAAGFLLPSMTLNRSFKVNHSGKSIGKLLEAIKLSEIMEIIPLRLTERREE